MLSSSSIFLLVLLRYTRNLIDEGNGKFNILLLCWAESQGSAIHDHSNAHCFMKCLDGELVENKYAWPSDMDDSKQKKTNEHEANAKLTTANNGSEHQVKMVVTGQRVMKKNDVCYINGNHKQTNKIAKSPSLIRWATIKALIELQMV